MQRKARRRGGVHLPLPLLGEGINLVLEVDDRFLVLLAKQLGSLLGLQVDIFEKFAELGELCIAFLVDLELVREKNLSGNQFLPALYVLCCFARSTDKVKFQNLVSIRLTYLSFGTALSLLKTLGKGDDLDGKVCLFALNLKQMKISG